MRAPSLVFYVALLFATHIFRIKLLTLLALSLAVGVTLLWRFLRLFKLPLRAPAHAAAFVSGATSGIGLQTAVQFARSGLLTFAGCRSVDDARELLKEAGSAANMIVPVECDVTSTTSVNECARLIREEMEKRQILGLYACTLNAGVMRCVPTEISDDLEQRESFETNYFGVVRCIQVFTPMLRYYADRSKDRAHLNIVSSVLGLFSGPGYAPYACTKFALEALTDALRPELAIWNICVSAYEFAAIESDVCDRINKEVKELTFDFFFFLILTLAEAIRRELDVLHLPHQLAQVSHGLAHRPRSVRRGGGRYLGQQFRAIPVDARCVWQAAGAGDGRCHDSDARSHARLCPHEDDAHVSVKIKAHFSSSSSS
jgi:NAD(P)-dependent dehydrogenase (short-subunit alcohol dehydrogenase family)